MSRLSRSVTRKKTRPKKAKKAVNPELSSSAHLSERTAGQIPVGQFECTPRCPLADRECTFKEYGSSCGLVDTYIVDLERNMMNELSHPLNIADALILHNVLRIAAALAWADIQLFLTTPVSACFDEHAEEFELRVSPEYMKSCLRLANEMTKQLETLKLTRKQRLAGGRGKVPSETPTLNELMNTAVPDSKPM